MEEVSPMVLVLDVGNTHVVAGIYGPDGRLLCHWRISSDRHKTEDEYGMLLLSLLASEGFAEKDVTGAIIASVVPPLTPIMERAVVKYFKRAPVIVGPGTKTGVNVRFENPKEVGPDRIALAVAALHKYGGPAIVVDFGTATTFDVVSKEGDYLGGAVAPGILTSLDALFEKAARLPRIELAKPQSAIGKTTVQSMQSGVIYGFAGLADGLIRRLARELAGTPRVIATGGLAKMVASESDTIEVVDQFLVLDGLYLIYERNAQEAGR
jgi:type III pantothenate kinase